jgi:hypothetical protein
MSIAFGLRFSEIFVEHGLAVHVKISSQFRALRRPADKVRISGNIWIFQVFTPAAGRDASVS